MNALQEINLMVKKAQVQEPTPSVVDSWSDAQKQNYLLSKPLTIPQGYTAATYKKHLNDIFRQGPRLENWPSRDKVIAAYNRGHAGRAGSVARTATPNSSATQPARWSNGQMVNPYAGRADDPLSPSRVASAKSTMFMKSLNGQLTENDAVQAIMARARARGMKNITEENARRLAPALLKNYRLNAQGGWVAKNQKSKARTLAAYRNAKPLDDANVSHRWGYSVRNDGGQVTYTANPNWHKDEGTPFGA